MPETTEWQDAQRAAQTACGGIFVGVTSSFQGESENEPRQDEITKQSPCMAGGAQFFARFFWSIRPNFSAISTRRICLLINQILTKTMKDVTAALFDPWSSHPEFVKKE